MSIVVPLRGASIRRRAWARFIVLALIALMVAPLYVLSARPSASGLVALTTISQSTIYALIIGLPLAAAEAIAFYEEWRGPWSALAFWHRVCRKVRLVRSNGSLAGPRSRER